MLSQGAKTTAARGALAAVVLAGALLARRGAHAETDGRAALERCAVAPPSSGCDGERALRCYGPHEAARVVAALRALPPREVAVRGPWNASTASPIASALAAGAALRASCALVGSSPSLLRARLGAEIDSHDFVLRANFAPATARYAPHVGARTDARLMSHAWVELGARARGTMIVHGPEAAADDRTANGAYNVLALGGALASGLGARGLKFGVSAGMRGVLLCLRLCGAVHLFGYDLDGGSPGHYYDDETEGIVPAHLALAAAEPERLRVAPATLGFGDGRRPLRVELAGSAGGAPRLARKGGVVRGALNGYVRNTYNREPHSMRYRHNFEWERLVLRALARAGCLRARPWSDAPPDAVRAAVEDKDARNVVAFRRATAEGRRWPGKGGQAAKPARARA